MLDAGLSAKDPNCQNVILYLYSPVRSYSKSLPRLNIFLDRTPNTWLNRCSLFFTFGSAGNLQVSRTDDS